MPPARLAPGGLFPPWSGDGRALLVQVARGCWVQFLARGFRGRAHWTLALAGQSCSPATREAAGAVAAAERDQAVAMGSACLTTRAGDAVAAHPGPKEEEATVNSHHSHSILPRQEGPDPLCALSITMRRRLERWAKSPFVQVAVGLPLVLTIALVEGLDDVVLGPREASDASIRLRGAAGPHAAPLLRRPGIRSWLHRLPRSGVGRLAFALGQLVAVTIGIWGVLCVILALADQAGGGQ